MEKMVSSNLKKQEQKKKFKSALILIILFLILGNQSLAQETSNIPKNQWTKGTSIDCRNNVTICSSKIVDPSSAAQTGDCIHCCSGADVFDKGRKCFNYCICECSLKANPEGTNTKKLCTKKKKK